MAVAPLALDSNWSTLDLVSTLVLITVSLHKFARLFMFSRQQKSYSQYSSRTRIYLAFLYVPGCMRNIVHNHETLCLACDLVIRRDLFQWHWSISHTHTNVRVLFVSSLYLTLWPLNSKYKHSKQSPFCLHGYASYITKNVGEKLIDIIDILLASA